MLSHTDAFAVVDKLETGSSEKMQQAVFRPERIALIWKTQARDACERRCFGQQRIQRLARHRDLQRHGHVHPEQRGGMSGMILIDALRVIE